MYPHRAMLLPVLSYYYFIPERCTKGSIRDIGKQYGKYMYTMYNIHFTHEIIRKYWRKLETVVHLYLDASYIIILFLVVSEK